MRKKGKSQTRYDSFSEYAPPLDCKNARGYFNEIGYPRTQFIM
jgi:hypothetical protein